MFFEIERCLSAELLLSNASERIVIDTGRISARRAVAEIAAEATLATGCVVRIRNRVTRRIRLRSHPPRQIVAARGLVSRPPGSIELAQLPLHEWSAKRVITINRGGLDVATSREISATVEVPEASLTIHGPVVIARHVRID